MGKFKISIYSDSQDKPSVKKVTGDKKSPTLKIIQEEEEKHNKTYSDDEK